MDFALAIIALPFAVTLLVVFVGTCMNALFQDHPVRWSKAGVSGFMREWMAHMVMGPLALAGLGSPAPEERPPAHPAEERLPVLIVPGFALNRGSLHLLALYLRRCGWRWVHSINHLPVDSPVPVLARNLALQVDALRHAASVDQIDIVAHSMGGVVAGWYINRMDGAGKVRRLVSIATPWQGTRTHVFGWRREVRDLMPGSEVLAEACPPTVPTVSIWSPADTVILPPTSSAAPGLQSVSLPHYGHMSLLISGRSWRAVGEALAATRAPLAPLMSSAVAPEASVRDTPPAADAPVSGSE
jgi:pimeloyl-ACP methyl ester carboxylesterase